MTRTLVNITALLLSRTLCCLDIGFKWFLSSSQRLGAVIGFTSSPLLAVPPFLVSADPPQALEEQGHDVTMWIRDESLVALRRLPRGME